MSWASIVNKFTPVQPAKETDAEIQAKAISKKNAAAAATADTMVRSNKGKQWEESYSNRVAYYKNREMVKAFKAHMDLRFNNLV
jgi:hypothetical protein